MLKISSKVTYQHKVEGTVGTFSTSGGRVCFLQTKARLSVGATDNESRLTGQLAPVREVLKMEKLNFNQLLQRDLDDHRVSTQLIPYLLEPKEAGPAFFPPILAAMLPFNGPTPEEYYPPYQDLGVQTEEEMYFQEMRWGAAFRFQRLSDEQGKPADIAFGRMSWNSEQSKLVVLDGQHRAMALIAIHRTLNETWPQSSGARYSHFYEHRIKDLLQQLRKQGKERIKSLKQTMTGTPDKDIPKKAHTDVAAELQASLEHWFRVDKKRFEAWLNEENSAQVKGAELSDSEEE